MKLSSFKQYLVEINKIRQYYKDNPDKIYKDEVPEKATKGNNFRPGTDAIYDLYQEFAEKYPEALEFAGIGKDEYRGRYDFKRTINLFNHDERFVKDDEKYNLIKSNEKYFKLFKNYAKKYKALQNIEFSKLEKIALSRGLKPQDISTIMDWVEHYTAESKRIIPAPVWPALRKLTVDDNELPKVIYRGLFMDGHKIAPTSLEDASPKDKAKIKERLEKWANYKKGDKIKLTVTKASSWSSSKAVASQFMDAQSKIKNMDRGYSLLLKYTITDPSKIVADFRKFPELKFWNQQELLLDPSEKEFEIVQIMPYNKENELRDYQRKNSKPGAGAWGSNKGELIIQNYLRISNLDIPKDIKETWKTYYDKTLGELEKIEPDTIKRLLSTRHSDYSSLLKQITLSLYSGLRALGFEVDTVNDKNEAIVGGGYQTKTYDIVHYKIKIKLISNSAQNKVFTITELKMDPKYNKTDVIKEIRKNVEDFNSRYKFAKVRMNLI